ncbi:MAG: hypothetical protein MJA83_13260 [Gammaproteobacteria bacterium]|nr:hypothetical protein [Gammaproteobacteria bacterium]
MAELREVMLVAHFYAGVLALILFWVPAFSKKGGKVHRTAGKIYVAAMSIVVFSAAPLSAYFWFQGREVTALFFGFLLLITFTAGWEGLQALRSKSGPHMFKKPFNYVLAVTNLAAGTALLGAAVYYQFWLFFIFAPIGILSGIGRLRFLSKPPADPKYWWYEHLGGMIGTGIAAHVAFGAFGVGRLFPEIAESNLGILPWLVPVIAGSAAIAMLNRHYRNKFAKPAI